MRQKQCNKQYFKQPKQILQYFLLFFCFADIFAENTIQLLLMEEVATGLGKKNSVYKFSTTS